METSVQGGLYDGSSESDEKDLPVMVACESPKGIHNRGKGKLWISINGGADYSTKSFNFDITDSADVFRISPQCGPKEGNTQVRLYGSGFVTENPDEQVFSLFGTVSAPELQREMVETKAWSQHAWLQSMHLGDADLRGYAHEDYPLKENQKLQTVSIKSPQVPDLSNSESGPVYISIGQKFGTGA